MGLAKGLTRAASRALHWCQGWGPQGRIQLVGMENSPCSLRGVTLQRIRLTLQEALCTPNGSPSPWHRHSKEADPCLRPSMDAAWSLRHCMILCGWLWNPGGFFSSVGQAITPRAVGPISLSSRSCLRQPPADMWLASAQGVDYRSQAWGCVCPWRPVLQGSRA